MMTQVTMYLNGFWSFVRLRMRVVRLRKCVEISPCQTGLHNPVSPLIHFCMLEILILILFLKRLTYHVTVSSDSCLYRLFYHIWNLHNLLNSNLKTFQGFTSSTTNWVSSVGWSPMMSVNIILVERKCNKSRVRIFTKRFTRDEHYCLVSRYCVLYGNHFTVYFIRANFCIDVQHKSIAKCVR